jgi:hypothetical protein
MKAPSAIQDRKTIFIIGAISVCLIAFLLYTNRKTEIVISITIEAPHGGVFTTETSCDPRPEYAWVKSALKVTSSTGIDQPLPQLTMRNTDTNQCAAEFLLELPPGQLYSVTLSGEKLGDVTDVNFTSKSANFRHEIRVTRTLNGFLRIAQPAECRRSGTTYWCGGVKLIAKAPYACEGYGGLSDLQEGTSVRVYSSTNQLIAQTSIIGTRWQYKNPKKQETIYCDLTWTVTNVPYDEKGYSVEMTERRGKVFFTKDQSANTLITTIGE